MSTTSTPKEIPQQALDSILEVMAALDKELKEENPQLEQHCVLINNNLRSFPDLIHLLTDEQARPFYNAMMLKANVVLAPKKAAAKKAPINPKLDDASDLFGF